MENSEIQKEIIELGKQFVKELRLEPGVDTISKWMAHYVAEKIALAKKSEGKQKMAAEKECFETILKLWKHRWTLQARRRPLENFGPLLNMLQRINPDKEEPYYFMEVPTGNVRADTDESKAPSPKWLDVAAEIDKVARVWLEFALKQAGFEASDEMTAAWVKNSYHLNDNEDTLIISSLLKDRVSFDFDDDESTGFYKKFDVEKLKSRIAQLEKFASINNVLLAAYKAELEGKSTDLFGGTGNAPKV